MNVALSNVVGIGSRITAAPTIMGDTVAAVDFLKMLRPNGTVCLTAILPDGGTTTATFETGDPAMAAWINRQQSVRNVYFTVNPTRSPITSKASARDVAEGVAVWVDLDPDKTAEAAPGGLQRERERIRAGMDQLAKDAMLGDAQALAPSFVVDSGGGFQAFWMLDAPTADTVMIEAINGALAQRLGGDPAVKDVCRIMRLPGTVNLPTKSKKARGRVPTLARLVPELMTGECYAIEQLSRFAGRGPASDGTPSPGHNRKPIGDESLKARDMQMFGRAVDKLPNDFPYDEAIKVLAAIKAGCGGDADFLAYHTIAFGERWQGGSGEDEAEWIVDKWETIDDAELGADYVYQLARDLTKGLPADRQFAEIEEFAASPLPDEPGDMAKPGDAAPRGYHAPPIHTIGRDIDLASIPPRVWTLGHRFSPGVVTLGIAEPAAGKTTVAVLSAVAIATGRELTGEKVCRSGAVWYIGNEEPLDELRRKLAAIQLAHAVPSEALAGRLHLSSFEELKLTVAAKDSAGRVRTTLAVNEMVDRIREMGIVHVVIDPLVSVHHGVEENDNAALEQVMTALRTIAVEGGCSIDLLHHTNKAGSGQAGNPLSARGASSIVGAVRSAYTLTRPTEDEASAAGLVVGSLVKMANAKANYSPRGAADRFYRIRGIDLLNGPPDGDFLGDNVGVAELFTMPSPATISAAAAGAEAGERAELVRIIAEAMSAEEVALGDMLPTVEKARDVKHAKARELIDEALPLDKPVETEIGGAKWLIEMKKKGAHNTAPKVITRRRAENEENN